MNTDNMTELLRGVFKSLGNDKKRELTAGDIVAIFSAVPPNTPVGIYDESGGGNVRLEHVYPGVEGIDIDISLTDDHPLL